MYSVGVVPVLVGAASVYSEVGALCWARFSALLIGAIFVIAWLNLSNDAFDAETGVDHTKPESVVNLTGNRTAVLVLSKAFLVCGLLLLGWGISSAGDSRIAAMLGVAIACGYVYQGPPFRFSYKGLGEPLCFMAFGPLATAAFYLAQLPTSAAANAAAAVAGSGTAAAAAAASVGSVPAFVWVSSVLVGITTTVILFCSHFHQIKGDTAAGKRSPLVRLGKAKGCQVLQAAVVLPYLMAFGASLSGVCSPLMLGCLALSLPTARSTLNFAKDNHTVPALIAPLKRYATKWHISFGLSLVLGLLLSRMIPL